MIEPPIIDHDPNETPKKRDELWWLIPLGVAVAALMWAWLFKFENPHWPSLGVGGFTGFVYAIWISDKPFLFSKKSPPDSR